MSHTDVTSVLVKAVWDRRRILFHIGCVTFLLAVAISLALPKLWTSTARIMPPESGKTGLAGLSSVMAANLPEAVAGDLLPTGSGNSGALFVGVLRSRTVQDRIIESFGLRSIYHAKTYDRAREELSARTGIAEDRKSGIITISVADRNPNRARDLCAAYINELNNTVAQLSTSAARRERIFLEGRLKTAKLELDDAERDLSEFSSKNATFDMSIQGRAMVDSVAGLQGQLIAAESDLRGLQSIYTENNVRVKAAKARVLELRNRLAQISGFDSKSDDSSDVNSPYPNLKQLPLLGARFTDLYRRQKIQSAVFETLTRQYELARVQEAKEIPTVRVLDIPLVPEKKTSPKRLQIVFMLTSLALMLGVGVIAGKVLWEQVSPTDSRKQLLEQILGDVQRGAQRLIIKMPFSHHFMVGFRDRPK